MTENEQEFMIENIDKNSWIKVEIDSSDSFFPIHYPAELLNEWFPREKFATPAERVEVINKALGTEITIIKISSLAHTIQRI
uniref:Uncharacterized protein n=1 Tax=Panagrolaimus sp. JU765 TaxID=591449 RepID=A0AC34R7T0_9BILA